MSAEMLAYPFLFISIFFESFVLITFLSAPARARRTSGPSTKTPSVAIIVPCFNEALTVGGTIRSLLNLNYPRKKLSIILVNDGSTDKTRATMEQFRDASQVTIIHKENGGKHTALNAGIAATQAEFVGCLDADSFVEPDALTHMIACFEKPEVAAATPAMSVHKPENLLQHMQNAEYTFGITLRHTLSSVNGLYVTPGPLSLYRKSAIEKVGGFRHAYQTEDMEMALRLQRAGYWIENAPRARVYTKAPRTLRSLIKQRTRWTSGFLRNILNEYRGLIGNRNYGALGMLVLPIALIAIASSMTLFVTAFISFGTSVVHAYSLRSGIPFTYAYTPQAPTFDWFYVPSTLYLALALVTIGASLTLIIMGKKLSRSPGSLMQGLLSYLMLYGFIAPLWLMRASFDVALGKKRAWR